MRVDREKRSGWLMAMLAAMVVFTFSFGLIYVNRVVAESERRDCESLLADIQAIEEGGQLTESGARVTLSRRIRYVRIGCEPHIGPPTFKIVHPPKTSK